MSDVVNAKTAPAGPLLEVRGLQKFFPITRGFLQRTVGHVRAVDGVDFTVNEGETLGLVGESGCGKTTASRCILRAIDPTGGKILYKTRDGRTVDLAALKPAELLPLRAEIQMIFQDPFGSLNPRMTLLDNVGEPLLVNGVGNRRERADRVAELLRLVGLRPEFMHRFPHAFSGGQRQRIGIARALATNPRLVVADEPTTAIDVTTQAQVLALLRDLQARYNTAIIFITHDLGVIAQMASYVVVMYLGRVMEQGPVDDIFHVPKHPYTKALLRSIPSLYGETRVALPVISGSLPHPFNRPAGCPFHPRCPQMMERCSTAVPSLQPVNDRQLASCFLYNDAVEPA